MSFRTPPSGRLTPQVIPFVSSDGPRLAIESDDRNRRHRLLLPPELRLQLIGLLRRVQAGEKKVQARPLTVSRVQSTSLSGDEDRYVIVHFHERITGNGMRLHRLPVRDHELSELIHDLYGTQPHADVRPESTLDIWA